MEPLNELAVFAGAGGGILGGYLLGWRTVCAVERDAYAAQVLAQRQNDRAISPFPIWSEVRSFDGRPWRGIAHVVSGGFPCTNVSAAGDGTGLDGEESGLWSEQARIIREVEPLVAWVENSPLLTVRGLQRVLWDLAEMGFDAEWGCVSAEDAIWLNGTPAVDHVRERIWIIGTHPKRLAESASLGSVQLLRRVLVQHSQPTRVRVRLPGNRRMGRRSVLNGRATNRSNHRANDDLQRCKEQQSTITEKEEHAASERCGWWQCEPYVGRVAHGVANRVDRLKAAGNGQVSAVVPLAWRLLTGATR